MCVWGTLWNSLENDHQCLEQIHHNVCTYLSIFLGTVHSHGLICNLCHFFPWVCISEMMPFFSPSTAASASTWDYADSGLNLFILFFKSAAWWASFLRVNDNGFQLSPVTFGNYKSLIICVPHNENGHSVPRMWKCK